MRFPKTLLPAVLLAAIAAAAGRPVTAELPPPPAFTADELHHRYETGGWPGRQFLALSRTGDGQAIEVVGDLATARTIIVYVPGSGQSLSSFDSSFEGPGRAARALHREATTIAPGVAVIGWLGYDPPDLINPEILTIWPAERGASRLRTFVRALPARARVSLVCHSYGSVVCGQAAPGLPVDDLVVTGSPGMGVRTAGQLRTPARVWAGLGRRDDVFRAGVRIGPLGFGTDPASPGFGARVFDGGTATHGGYLKPGSPTLKRITRIAVTGTTG
ncbi:Alpha/beta hydrolase [Nonomuraea solani]|uniref:Alpha/beta hydrolase n=1 Tax=Nonomuraea solani TaxID=1144553 RepID=A0A1H6ESX8_9ACTN|nr:alpha/beta hydrolase [Nonomuraea solani]SEH00967.1 Alpha/beta hydrolase [Nonomuraea solani]